MRDLSKSALWAASFAGVAALATLWLQSGHDLAGGLAFAVNRLPRHLILRLGGPDIDKLALWDALSTGLFVFLLALVVLLVTARGRSAEAGERGKWPTLAVVFGCLLLYEVAHLLLGEMPRYRFGQWTFTFLLPWHIVALAVTVTFIAFSKRSVLPGWMSRGYWLLMFAMALAVLFPMTDSL